MKTLSENVHTALISLSASTQAVGDLLAYVEVGEVDANNVKELGWLLMALGEIGCKLLDVQCLIQDQERNNARQAAAV